MVCLYLTYGNLFDHKNIKFISNYNPNDKNVFYKKTIDKKINILSNTLLNDKDSKRIKDLKYELKLTLKILKDENNFHISNLKEKLLNLMIHKNIFINEESYNTKSQTLIFVNKNEIFYFHRNCNDIEKKNDILSVNDKLTEFYFKK
jgi:uncharacterized protein with NRDE domain